MATVEEKEKLEKETLPKFEKKLKENDIELNPEFFDQYTTVRFLRARKYDIEAAYTMLVNHLKWRKDNDVDTILETSPKTNKNFKSLEKYWPGLYAGIDKDGVPVWIERGGQIDADSLLAIVPMDDIINYHIYATEKTMRLKKEISAKLGKNCYYGVIIEDVEGFSRKHMGSNCIDLFKRMSAINADNYPECLKAFICINSPTLLSVAYKLVKSFIDPETRKKILVLGGKYRDELLQYIDDDQLIKEYGGKNTSVKLKGGGPYADLKSDGSTYNPFTTTISAGGVLTVPITVNAKYVPTKINYTFTANADIKFSVVYTGDDGKGKKENVVEPKSVDPAADGEQKGSVKAEKAGVYVFTFDNSHTWVKSRTLTYHLVVDKSSKVQDKSETTEKKKKKRKSKS